MNISRLIDTLKRHEGAVRKAGRHYTYIDSVGKYTIGYGRNLTDKGISEEEALFLLNNDIKEVVSELQNNYHWFSGLDNIRQEVIVNMAFNLGIVGFSKFKGTIQHIAAEEYEDAAEHMLDSLWAKQVKGRATELAEMMRTGKSLA